MAWSVAEAQHPPLAWGWEVLEEGGCFADAIKKDLSEGRSRNDI